MKSMLIVYHDLYEEVRSEELLKLLKLYGEVVLVSYAYYEDNSIKCINNKNNKKDILLFLKNAKKAIIKEKPDLILLHDDYPMIFVPFIKRHCKNSIIIHDASELRLTNEKQDGIGIKSFVAKYFRYFEKWYTKRTDVVIAANNERAEIMKQYCALDDLPVIFENVHKIECDYNLEECQNKYGSLFNENRFTAIYAGGVAEKRLTYDIAKQIGKMSDGFQLLIVGDVERGGVEKLDNIIADGNIKNVKYLGFISRAELKYLFEKGDVSISAFAMDTVNNINCASGKIYEGFFEGKPLLAGINPPLKRICDENGVGVSTNDFAWGLEVLKKDYQYYVENVKKYISTIKFDDRICNLKYKIDSELGNKGLKDNRFSEECK